MRHLSFLALILLVCPGLALGAGFTQHQFMADLGLRYIQEPSLLDLMREHRDAYLVGAYFPDVGYGAGEQEMGDRTHDLRFIDLFIQHIRTSYPAPYTGQQKLISFLLGVGSHNADDPPYHNILIRESARRDFGGDYETAHTYCDTGLEFIVIIEHNRWWDDIPRELWMPVEDLLEVYDAMGMSFVTTEMMVNGGTLIHLGNYAERWVANLLYSSLVHQAPWTARSYYWYPGGGLHDCGKDVGAYYNDIWQRLHAPAPPSPLRPWQSLESPIMAPRRLMSPSFAAPSPLHSQDSPIHRFSREALSRGVVEMRQTRHADGSITVGPPRVVSALGLARLLDELVREVLGN
jgi:hypothetical protein